MVDEMASTGTAGDAMGGMGGSKAMWGHSMSLAAFVVAWLAMMAAMMLPAVSPVVRLYSLAAANGRVAPLPFFVAGYLVVWTSVGLPAYFGWQALMDPISDGRPWAGRLGGAVLLIAAVWQLTPLKSLCLRHCRSPMSVFLTVRGSLARPSAALLAGTTHGLYCLGCCWALMAILVALGTMNLAWMLGLAVLILLEKNAPWGEAAATGGAIVFVGVAIALVVHPAALSTLT